MFKLVHPKHQYLAWSTDEKGWVAYDFPCDLFNTRSEAVLKQASIAADPYCPAQSVIVEI